MASDRADVSHADRRFALIVLKNNVKPLGHDVNFLLEPVATDARFITLKTRLHAEEFGSCPTSNANRSVLHFPDVFP